MKPWTIAGMLAVLASHAHAATTYVLDPAGGHLSFAFVQAGAENTGQFRKFDVKLTLDDRKPADNRLDVQISVASLDTQDEERDEILRSADLFDVAEHPTASFVSKRIKRFAAGRYVAAGTLTIRGVAREVQVPFALADGRMSGSTTIRRLDFGVGQGEWKSTEWVGNDVKVSFALRLAATPSVAQQGVTSSRTASMDPGTP